MYTAKMPTFVVVAQEQLLDLKSQALVSFLPQNFAFDAIEVAESYCPALKSFFAQDDFTGKRDEIIIIPVVEKNIQWLVFAGLGKESIDIEVYRRALVSVIKKMQRKNIASLTVVLPPASLFGVSPMYLAEQTAIIGMLASYAFDEYLTNEHAKFKQNLSITLVTTKADLDEVNTGVAKGTIIGQAANRVRHWIDLPPCKLTPVELADKAQTIAKEFDLGCTIFSESEIIHMGMGGLAGVSSGSDQDCKLVILEYKAARADAPTIAFVGKGITFDSGGLSIKPAEGMETMKEDMSGAAAVIGTMQAIAQLKPDVNVIGITPLSENMPSGKAAKPGDIVRFYNGKTGEILNIDAEGRLILADALSYAVKHFKLAALVDIATLTGLCHHFFGPFYSALCCNNPALANKIQAASKISGERVWLLPHDRDYKQAVKSKVADVKNIGSKAIKSGTITAAWFLEHFVDDVPWAHLDIAGAAYSVPLSYYSDGATGVGVRLLVELALNWQ